MSVITKFILWVTVWDVIFKLFGNNSCYGISLNNLFRSVPRPDDSAIGWGVTDWYQSHNYRELG